MGACENSLLNQAVRWVELKSLIARYLLGLIDELDGVSFGLIVMKPTRKLSVSGVNARLAALLVRLMRVR